MRGATVVVCLGLLGAPHVRAEPALPGAPGTASEAQDIVLLDSNVMLGKVVDAEGIPARDQQVSLLDRGQPILFSQTGTDGRFAVSGLTAGVYQVSAGGHLTTLRLWTPSVAPPSANSEAVIVAGAAGGSKHPPRRRWLGVLGNPWVVGGLAASAVVIPLALDDNDDDQDDDDDDEPPIVGDLPPAS